MSHNLDDSGPFESQQAWLQKYIDNPEKQKRLYKRTLIIVVLSQIFGGAGLAAGITVGALLAQDMLGSESIVGVPSALFTLGSALAAYLVGNFSQRTGRRLGLGLGFIIGGLGSIGVVLAAVLNNIPLLFVSLFIYGAGTASNLLARYAGTDLANTKQRGTAVSIAMVSTTFGAVAGPNLVEVMGRFATNIGIPPLSGPFILSAAAYILAGIILLIFLRPDPLILAKAIANAKKTNRTTSVDQDEKGHLINTRGVVVGATIMIVSQLVMVSIMSMTPVHMGLCGFGLNSVGIVIGIHVAAMYLPSLVTGMLVDKIGRTVMAIASGITLLAGILAALAPTNSMLMLTIALALLGLGWNFGFISGTALIIDGTTLSNRAKVQGTIDVFIALSGALGGILAGVMLALFGYTTLSYVGGLLSLILIPVVIWSRGKSNRKQMTSE